MFKSDFPRWQPMAADAGVSLARVANEGFSLSREGNVVMATPNPSRRRPPLFNRAPLILPSLPIQIAHRCTRWLRDLYGGRGCTYAFALYLDCTTREWRPALPPGMCSPDGFRVNLRDVPQKQLNDGRSWRLAGTFQSALFAEEGSSSDGAYLSLVPAFDGAHFLIDPRYYFLPRIVLRFQDRLEHAEPATAFFEPLSEFDAASNEVWCLTKLD